MNDHRSALVSACFPSLSQQASFAVRGQRKAIAEELALGASGADQKNLRPGFGPLIHGPAVGALGKRPHLQGSLAIQFP